MGRLVDARKRRSTPRGSPEEVRPVAEGIGNTAEPPPEAMASVPEAPPAVAKAAKRSGKNPKKVPLRERAARGGEKGFKFGPAEAAVSTAPEEPGPEAPPPPEEISSEPSPVLLEPGTLPAFGFAEDILSRLPASEPAGGEVDAEPREEPSKPILGDAASGGVKEKYVTFFLDREEYGLPIGRVQEINRVGEITRVPNAPDHVLGVINLRGKILPVLELKKRLNLGESALTKQSRVVVVEMGSKLLGLLVDSVSQVVGLDKAQIEAAPETVRAHEQFIVGVGKLEDRMIILLDVARVLTIKDSTRQKTPMAQRKAPSFPDGRIDHA